MITINFKNSVTALAIGLVMVSCGSRSSNQQSGDASETKTEAQTEQAKSSGGITAASIVGTWVDERTMQSLIHEFKADGKGVTKYLQDESKKEVAFTWKISGNKVTFDTEDGGYNQFEFIGDNQIEDAMRQKFNKQ